MANKHTAPLTAGEIGILWNNYLVDSMSLWVERVHAAHEQDAHVRALIMDTVAFLEKTTAEIQALLERENLPAPAGFTAADVDLAAPPLYTGVFRLQYVKNKVNIRLAANGLALAGVTRADVREFYRNVTLAVLALDDKATELLLEKGLYIRAPYVPVDAQREFVSGRDFLGSFFGAGHRSLLAVETGVLHSNIQNNIAGRTLLTGFAQTAGAAEVRRYMLRGVEIAGSHIDILSALLRDEAVPVPATWDAGVTTSTVAPFSDRLMLNHVAFLNQAGLAACGTNTAAASRKDLQATYLRLAADIARYAAEGANLLIDNAWAEEPPKVASHRESPSLH